MREVLEYRPLRRAQCVDSQLGANAGPGHDFASAFRSGDRGAGHREDVDRTYRAALPGSDAWFRHPARRLGSADRPRAQRLSDSIRLGLDTIGAPLHPADASLLSVSAQTLHRLLGYSPDRGTFRHHAENPLEADFIIIDEVSMVGLELMHRLFQALRPSARLLLLGDKDQLPSVDAGAVLANLMATSETPGYSRSFCKELAELFADLRQSPVAPVADPDGRGNRLQDAITVLERNHRSQAEIQEVARAINARRSCPRRRAAGCCVARRRLWGAGPKGWLLAARRRRQRRLLA